MAVSAYILIQTEVGKASAVVDACRKLTGVVQADDVTGPYDVILRAEAGLDRRARAAWSCRRCSSSTGSPARSPAPSSICSARCRIGHCSATVYVIAPRGPTLARYGCYARHCADRQPQAARVGRALDGDPPARSRPLVRRLRGGERAPLPRSSSSRARSRRSTRPSGRTASTPAAIPATSPGSRTARSSAASARSTPARPITGARPPRCARRCCTLFTRRDARPHALRRAVLDGSARFADRAHRRRAHRLRVRRGQHAHDDPHGPGRARRARRRRRVRAVRPLGRHAARAGSGRRAVAVQQRRQVHRALPRDARDPVVRLGLRRQRAARQEVLRAAHRERHGARRGLARRAHAHPQAHEPGGRGALRRRRVPERVRQDEPRDARARRFPVGRPRRSATTSAG